MKSVGIVGFGSFSQFLVKFIKPHLHIKVSNRSDKSKAAEQLGVEYADVTEVIACDIVVLSIPVQFLESFLIEYGAKVNPKALVLDVSSVKVKPVDLMIEHLPKSTDIIGTHPLFGPQSGKNGIKGLNMVICPVRSRKIRVVEHFLQNMLQLNIMERTAETHDRQMAYVQALTHFVGRAVNQMDIPDVEQKTPAYQYLLNIKRNLGQDSFELFQTIENENPFAKGIREEFLQELTLINKSLH